MLWNGVFVLEKLIGGYLGSDVWPFGNDPVIDQMFIYLTSFNIV